MEEMNAGELQAAAERLMEAASVLEKAVAKISEQQVALAAEAESQVTRIVATVETQREAELERKLAEAEEKIAQSQARIAELVASASVAQPVGRKTLPTSMATMLAKQGVVMDSVEAGAIDGALASLSIEQRIAVKSELMRAGLLNPADRG